MYIIEMLFLAQSQVNVMSPKALSASVSDIDSIVCMTDRVPSSAPLNKSKGAVGMDLAGTVASRLRRKCSRFGGTNGSRRTRHYRCLMDCEGFDLSSLFTQRSRITEVSGHIFASFFVPLNFFVENRIINPWDGNWCFIH